MEVVTSAPAKIIIFGEHSVTYGKLAVTAAADCRATCRIRVRRGTGVTLRGAGQSERVSLDELLSFRWRVDALRVEGDHAEIRALTQGDFFAPSRYILGTALAHTEATGLDISFETDIPIGAGLGSGGAVFAALSLGLAKILRVQPARDQAAEWAYLGDVIAHGGIASRTDTSTSVHGGFLQYSKRGGVVPLETEVRLDVVVGDTLKRAATSAVNERVRSWLDEDNVRYHYFGDMDTVARFGVKALMRGDLEMLGRLMNINQTLLERIGVSCPEIDSLVSEALRAKALGAKLSGSGGGGIIVALVTPNRREPVARAIQSAGGKPSAVQIGAPGARVEES